MRGPDQALGVDALVGPELAVLGGDHRVLQDLRDVLLGQRDVEVELAERGDLLAVGVVDVAGLGDDPGLLLGHGAGQVAEQQGAEPGGEPHADQQRDAEDEDDEHPQGAAQGAPRRRPALGAARHRGRAQWPGPVGRVVVVVVPGAVVVGAGEVVVVVRGRVGADDRGRCGRRPGTVAPHVVGAERQALDDPAGRARRRRWCAGLGDVTARPSPARGAGSRCRRRRPPARCRCCRPSRG